MLFFSEGEGEIVEGGGAIEAGGATNTEARGAIEGGWVIEGVGAVGVWGGGGHIEV